MLNKMEKIINNGSIESNKKKPSFNASYNSQNRKASVSSKLAIYMNSEENNGISLYTHIQALLDIFIFQNPIKPITYFEYYSEQLKQYYGKPQPNRDVEFLKNIKKDICDKIMDIYKDTSNKNNEYQLSDNKSIKDIYFEESFIGYEGEGEYENDTNNANKSNNITVQDLAKINYVFSKAGCGMTNDEVSLIGITMNQLSHFKKFKNIRYWGKIFGLKRNYYILECEWQDEELEYKLKILNFIMDKMKNKNIINDYDNIYENEEELIELEKDVLSVESNEIVNDETFETTLSASHGAHSKKIKNKYFQESNLIEKSTCIFPPKEPSIDDHLSHEIIGFGTNKKSYFVTNQLNDEWVELPVIKPHHIIQSRHIKRYFVGDLEAPVDSYPLFQGLEKHYLRAQIARITAATQISPQNYFVIDNKSKSNKWTKLNHFQSKVLSQKWIHDYVMNQNYDPPSPLALMKPNNWVHHAPLILEEGVTMAWNRFIESENNENQYKLIVSDIENEEDISQSQITIDQFAEENNSTLTLDDVYSDQIFSDIFVSLSEDTNVGELSPWKFEMSNPFDHTATYAVVKSNFWPGAFAVTRDKILDYTYCGWGHKLNVNGCMRSIVMNEYQSEYPNNTEETTELKDPTNADEVAFLEKVKQLKEEKTNTKNTANLSYSDEKVINKYDYE